MPHWLINGTRLEVQTLASAHPQAGKAPLVFLHEGLGSVAAWHSRGQCWPQRVCDATGRAGLLYSRRGYGQSDDVPDVRVTGRLAPDYLHHEAYDTLPALLAVFQCDRPVLVGHSDGGSIALLYAGRHPVSACVVMAPHIVVEELTLVTIEQAKVTYEHGDLRARLARHHAHVDTAFWQWNDVWLSDGFRSFDIRSQCTEITSPVLALQGIDDPYGTACQIDEIRPRTPVIHRHFLSECGHAPHKDQPEQSLALIESFLSRCD